MNSDDDLSGLSDEQLDALTEEEADRARLALVGAYGPEQCAFIAMGIALMTDLARTAGAMVPMMTPPDVSPVTSAQNALASMIFSGGKCMKLLLENVDLDEVFPDGPPFARPD